jgi:mono/diheme cytochrome c family protein
MISNKLFALCVIAPVLFSNTLFGAEAGLEYAAVDAIFTKHCLDCHAAPDPEGKFILENYESLLKGGEIGSAIVPGKSSDSLLVRMIEGKFEKDGKKKIMPPGKRQKLDKEEIAAIKIWIDAGAHGPPAGTVVTKDLAVPQVAVKVAPRMPVMALAYAASLKLIAVGSYGKVELRSLENGMIQQSLTGHHGNVNAVIFSADGTFLFAAAGQPGVFGEVRQWKVADGTLVRTFEGHNDAIYAAALSPDAKTLATGSYDQKIKLWNVETGKEIKTLSGHNGAVFSLAFRPDGKILASASADRTVKLWDVTSGERRDTLSQPTKEVYAVAFSPDGKRLVAGGVDNRIRIWEISETAAETTNPLLDSKFAHEGSILNLVFSHDGRLLLSSAEDRTLKLWDGIQIKERFLIEDQPDWVRAMTFVADDKTLAVGRMDGTVGFYNVMNGKPLPDAPASTSKVAIK